MTRTNNSSCTLAKACDYTQGMQFYMSILHFTLSSCKMNSERAKMYTHHMAMTLQLHNS